MKRFFLIPFMLLLVLLPLACQKTYTVGPLAPTPVPAFTSTPTQNPFCTVVALPTAGTIPNGIVWGAAEIMSTDYIGLHLDVSVMLYLAVNGAPESTDAVTMSGPGYAGPVSYNGPATVSGDVFAFYTSPAGGSPWSPGRLIPSPRLPPSARPRPWSRRPPIHSFPRMGTPRPGLGPPCSTRPRSTTRSPMRFGRRPIASTNSRHCPFPSRLIPARLRGPITPTSIA